MADTNTIVRKNLRDLNNPLVVRELNRQMDWIWKKLLGGIQEKDLDPDTATKIIKRTEETITQKISAGSVETDELVASLAALMVAQIGIANIDFQKVVDMTTEQAIIKRMMANKVFIEKLVVTEANILSATLGTLVLKSSDGKYYTIAISSDGTIETEEVIPTEDDIANGSYEGREIVTDTEGNNIADLNATNLSAQNAMIGTILTTALTAGKITAAEAMLASAVIPELYVTAVNAIGDSMTFKSNELIQMIISDVVSTREIANNAASYQEFQRVIRILSDGLHIGDNQSPGEVLIDSESVNVVMNGQKYSRFGANYVQFGRTQLRGASDGGMLFRVTEV